MGYIIVFFAGVAAFWTFQNWQIIAVKFTELKARLSKPKD